MTLKHWAVISCPLTTNREYIEAIHDNYHDAAIDVEQYKQRQPSWEDEIDFYVAELDIEDGWSVGMSLQDSYKTLGKKDEISYPN